MPYSFPSVRNISLATIGLSVVSLAAYASEGERIFDPAPVTASVEDEALFSSMRDSDVGEEDRLFFSKDIPAFLSKKAHLNVLFGGFTAHFSSREGGGSYNEVQNTLGLEFEARLSGDIYWGLAAAYMRNSLDNDSALFGAELKKKWKLSRDWVFAFGGLIGFQNGYPKASKGREKSDFTPVAYPMAELHWKRLGAYFTCVPKVHTSGFCFAGFKLRALDF